MCLPRLAKRTGNIDDVARFRSIAPQRFAARDRSAHHHVAGHLRGARQIATGKSRVITLGQLQESFQERVDPLLIGGRRQRQRQQAEPRLATHCRDVAQATRQRLVADRIRGKEVALEVDILNQIVRRKEQIFIGPRTVNRAVIPDAKLERGLARLLTDALDQIDLGHLDSFSAVSITRPEGNSSPNRRLC